MPEKFNSCVKNGGRVRTKQLSDGRYLRICFPLGGGPGIAGEVKERAGNRLKNAIKNR